MSKTNVQQYNIIVIETLLDLINPGFYMKENISENIEEEIDTLKLKKAIKIVADYTEQVTDIDTLSSDAELSKNVLENCTDEDFEELKNEMLSLVEAIKNNEIAI